MSKIKPLNDRVLVSRKKEENTTKGGIYIPDTASKEKPIEGKVIAIGPGKMLDNGTAHPLGVKPGDTVLFGKYSGTEVKLENDEYVIMREEDILAVVE